MAIKLTLDGAELTFDTVAEYNEFARTNAAITDEGVAADEITTQEDEIRIGDKVEIIGNTNDEHYHDIGDIGVVVGFYFADIDVRVNDLMQTVRRADVKKVDSEAKEGKRIPEGYERVSFSDAEEGDFYLALDCYCDIEKGRKYVITEDWAGDLGFEDDGEDFRELVEWEDGEDGIVIRKIAEDGKEDTSVKVGDIVTGTSDKHYGYTTDKALMQVTDVYDGKINVKILKSVDNPEKEGREYDVYPEHFVKTTEEEFNAKHELSADKDTFKNGDRVKAIAGIHAGSEGTVQRRFDYEGFYVLYDGDDDNSYTYEYNLELADDKADKYERITFADAKVGDYWIADEESVDITVGRRYLITEVYVDDDGDKVVKFDDDEGDERERYHFSGNGHIEREVSESKPKFKVGDKVRVAAAGYHHLEDGHIGEILRVSEVNEHIRNGKRTPTPYYVGHQFIAAEDLTLVTDEEESKVTTFKVGDKVRVKSHWMHNFADGTVGEIVDEFGDEAFVVKTDDPSQQSVSSFSHGKGTQSILTDLLTLVTDDEVQTQGASFEEGDRVVVTGEGDGDCHYFKKGTVGTVIGFSDLSGRIYVQADSTNAWIADSEYAGKDDNAQYISESNLETFTSKHIEVGAKYEVVERAERYTIGLYADKGTIIEVKDVLSDGDIHVENVDGSESGVLILAKEAHKLRKVEEGEVQTQEIDFEKGDIVRMVEDVTDHYGDKIKEGRLAVVDWLPSDRTEIAVKQREGKPIVIVPKRAVELVAKAIK